MHYYFTISKDGPEVRARAVVALEVHKYRYKIVKRNIL